MTVTNIHEILSTLKFIKIH